MTLGPLDDGLRVIREGLNGRGPRHRQRHPARPRRRQGRRPQPHQRRPVARPLSRISAVFSIDRPIFAMVLSIVLLIVGALAYTSCRSREYPRDRAADGRRHHAISRRLRRDRGRDGRHADRAADQRRRGHALHVVSQATATAAARITVTFKLGTDLDKAQVLVQNRVAIAQPRLPDEVQRIGVTTQELARPPDGRASCCRPTTATTSSTSRNYALLARPGPAAAARRRRRRPDLRRARLLDARLARSRPDRRRSASPPATSSPRSAGRTCRSRAARSASRRSPTARSSQPSTHRPLRDQSSSRTS